MINIESNESIVNTSQERVFTFLGDFRNFSGMMPEDIMQNIVLEEQVCRFEIKGLGPAGLTIEEKVPYSLLKIKNTNDTPADFTLKVVISPVTSESTSVKFLLDARMNMFIEMMARGPLQKFLDLLAEKVKDIK